MYSNIVKQLALVAEMLESQKNKNDIIKRLAANGHLRVFEIISDEESSEEQINTTSTTTTQRESSEEESESSEEEIVTRKQIEEISADLVERNISLALKGTHSELSVVILRNFLNSLVEYQGTPTTSAFMHRCYLSYAKKNHKTNAKTNVIQDANKFKEVLRSVVGEYEAKEGNGRSRGWKLAVVR